MLLSWEDRARNEEGYRLERSARADFATVDAVVTLRPLTTHYVDRGLAPGATYYYRLVAFNGGGESAAVTSGPLATPAGPPAPTGLTAVEGVPGERVDLSWTDNAAGWSSSRARRERGVAECC